MIPRIVIRAEEVQALEGCSASTAYERIRLAKAALDKKPYQKLTIAEFCNYYGYDLELVTDCLTNLQKAS
ncbi:hypothetical protein AAU57_06590 [Nonlabens sp. YIK11]|uniref:hypothetical protein n=1 Tax=Nonlabens sp. YIK11 TaxID=1453349 RepID=UPI0006DC9864|nr:hypothetical protein [Nonlabens sp. YIK11]KQC33025.1 hypothetical protein AAU57_06590 [Nonlabens sp. YIK11]